MPSRAATIARGAWQRDSSPCSEAATPEAAEATAACARELAGHLATGEPAVLACDACAEGVLAAVGITYLAHAREGQVRLARRDNLQPQLGEAVIAAPSARADATVDFARRVMRGFARKVTPACHRQREGACPASCAAPCLHRLALACASDDPRMPEVVHRYLRLGFAVGPRVRQMIAHPQVVAFNDLARFVSGECEHTRQFVRFSHVSDGSFVATFAPKADTIPLVADHFAARMGPERFFVVDPRHQVAAFHEEGRRHCQIVRVDARLAAQLTHGFELADDERYVRTLWQHFYQGTSLPGRDRSQRGYDLRVHWMPKRLWEGLTELAPHEATSVAPPARYAEGPAPQGRPLPEA